MLFSGRRKRCAGGSQNAANPNCSAEVHGSCLDSAPLKVSPKRDLLSGCSPSCCVFFIIIFASKDWLIGVTPLRTMKRECSLIAKLACTAKASKLRESCTTFKPRNFPETTMQLCHKTFDWKHATSFIVLHSPSLALLTSLGLLLTHRTLFRYGQWMCLVYSHIPSTSMGVSMWLLISFSVLLVFFFFTSERLS